MRSVAALLFGLTLLAGAAGSSAAQSGRDPNQLPSWIKTDDPAVARDLAALRGMTASFKERTNAEAAGWSTVVTGCLSNPAGDGAMGFHLGNASYIDGTVRVDQPELLLYEPMAHGRVRLVAVEYIVPLDKWTDSAPPRLFGRDFHVNQQFQVWALHAWVWEQNPSGVFADWNPRVSCANAETAGIPMPASASHMAAQ